MKNVMTDQYQLEHVIQPSFYSTLPPEPWHIYMPSVLRMDIWHYEYEIVVSMNPLFGLIG